MTTPLQIQDLVAELVHAYPSAKLEFDPLPSGVCFLWLTVAGRNFCLEYHPRQGTGISENLPDTSPFSGHDQVFNALDPAIDFLKQIVARAAEESLAVLTQ